MTRQLIIFDTTLRDGEQAPGCSMNSQEKLAVARKLEKLGVDVIEAGFPASSPGDLESVRNIARIIKDSVVAGLCRALEKDIDTGRAALEKAGPGDIVILSPGCTSFGMFVNEFDRGKKWKEAVLRLTC